MVFKMDLSWWIRTSKLAACDREGLWDRHVSLPKKKHLEALHPEQSEMLVVCGGVLGASFLIKGLSMGHKKKTRGMKSTNHP